MFYITTTNFVNQNKVKHKKIIKILTVSNIIENSFIEENNLLGNNTDNRSVGVLCECADIIPVNKDTTVDRVVQSTVTMFI